VKVLQGGMALSLREQRYAPDMWDEPTGIRFYVLLVPILVIIGAGIWWRATGYRTDVGLGIIAAGLAALIVVVVATRVFSRRS
jgi:hypothetical protein